MIVRVGMMYHFVDIFQVIIWIKYSSAVQSITSVMEFLFSHSCIKTRKNQQLNFILSFILK